ncbi:MAG: IS30 family transposase [Bythopirellula sp.]
MARHVTMEERDRIAQLKHQGVSQQEIARALQRSPSTISRELRRNGSGNEYFAAQAQHRAVRRRRERPLMRKMDDPDIKANVCGGLAKYWSPEQVAGRLQRNAAHKRLTVSARTIYTWIANDKNCKRWCSFLRNRGKRGVRSKRPDVIGAPIDQRPKIIEARSRLGDFEGDTVLGPGKGGLATLVDRKSRYTIIAKIGSKYADHVHQKIKQRLKKLDANRRHSLTLDNGTEFAHCGRLLKHPGVKLYLAEPGKPHQRGTNENTNGLIRQFYPKGTRFRNVTHQNVHRVQNLLNNRPRACLGYRTPNEVFFGNSVSRSCD